jgi:hypothetical protein
VQGIKSRRSSHSVDANAGAARWRMPASGQTGTSSLGPHVRLRQVQTLVRDGSRGLAQAGRWMGGRNGMALRCYGFDIPGARVANVVGPVANSRAQARAEVFPPLCANAAPKYEPDRVSFCQSRTAAPAAHAERNAGCDAVASQYQRSVMPGDAERHAVDRHGAKSIGQVVGVGALEAIDPPAVLKPLHDPAPFLSPGVVCLCQRRPPSV